MNTKKNIFLIVLLSFSTIVFSQSAYKNYIKISKVTKIGISHADSISSSNTMQSVQYVDGLGRPIQSIQIGISPTGGDLVQGIAYDEYGRQAKDYLPFMATYNNGDFITEWKSRDSSFYKSPATGVAATDYYYADKEFDNSPLNRVLKQGAPGADWQLNGHPVGFDFKTNNSSDEVLLWEYNPSTGQASSTSLYDDGSIYISQTIDENGHSTKEYKDLQSRVILKTSFLTSDTLYTYYVYDNFGNLGTVIPPKAYALMVSANNYDTEDLNQDLVYTYKYDERQRMVEKNIPGQKEVYMVYDKLNRLVLTQDANMREQHQWLFTKYDVLSRPVSTGIYHNASDTTREAVQTLLNNESIFFETFDAGTKNYSCQAFPVVDSITEYLSYNYYDTYDFIPTAKTYLEYSVPNDPDFPDWEDNFTPKGLPTGSKVKILGTLDEFLYTANYYDDKDRIVQTVNEHAKDGYDISNIKYDFLANPLLTTLHHAINISTDSETTKMKWWYHYDHAGRLIDVKHQVNEQAAQYIVQNQYNDLGQLIEKNLHSITAGDLNSGFRQSVDYRYNVRGWLTAINDPEQLSADHDLFAMKLLYNEGFNDGDITAQAEYNGNISGMQWCDSIDAAIRAYGFSYDNINRLKAAKYAEKASTFSLNTDHYSVSNLQYDLNGNIESLWRQGENTGTTTFDYGYIDQLSYNYMGNTLLAVNDGIEDIAGVLTNDFKDRLSNDSLEYTYDGNGNMTSDDNKGIVNIKYNYLNLPEEIDFGSGNKISYIYTADGTKLAKQVYDNSSLTSTKTYAGSFIYNDDGLEYALFDEGRLIESGGSFDYQYFLKDHLGNTRVTFSGNTGSILQQDHYYPFGMNFRGVENAQAANVANQYKYNGKELQEDHGLDWYDYGARFYDASLGRWHVMDNKAEKYYATTPYAYCINNPIIFIDPDGNEVRLSFASSSAQTAYTNLVNNSLGGAYKVSYTTVKDGQGYTNQASLTAVKDFSGTLSDSQKAFATEFGNAVNSSDVARMEVVENDANTVVGSWVTGKLDVADIAEFDKAGTGAASSAGALIHETTEQVDKAKSGLNSGDIGAVKTDSNGKQTYPDYQKSHKKATQSENKVNGNTRKEQQGYFLEKDGTKTQQTLNTTSNGGITVQKKKIK